MLKGDQQNVEYVELEVHSAFSISSDKIMKYAIHVISPFFLFQHLAPSHEHEFFKALQTIRTLMF